MIIIWIVPFDRTRPSWVYFYKKNYKFIKKKKKKKIIHKYFTEAYNCL